METFYNFENKFGYTFVKVKRFPKIKNNNKAYRSRRAILKNEKRRKYGLTS